MWFNILLLRNIIGHQLTKRISILSTGDTGDLPYEGMVPADVALDVIPFIACRILESKALDLQIGEIAKSEAQVVFTSKHAVMAVAKVAAKMPVQWSVYCLGNTTQSVVVEQFNIVETPDKNVRIAGVGDNAKELANKIIKDNVKNIVFFCGDQRLDTLSGLLLKAGVAVREVVVYEMKEVMHVVEDVYDGVLFYSPSAANSFFRHNRVSIGTVLFAIGQTTAAALRELSNNKIVVCSTPSKVRVLQDAIEYFNSSNHNN
jgi:uroporphyrinogen-III synthase